MTRSEAGRLGGLKVRSIVSAKHKKMVDEYYSNPNLCLKCHRVIPYEKRRNDFCSQQCAAKFYNSNKYKIGVKNFLFCKKDTEQKTCKIQHIGSCIIVCGRKTNLRKNKFCSSECFRKYRKMEKIEEVDRLGEFSPSHSVNANGEASRVFVRTYLEFKFGHKCSICGISEWNGKPITLVVDHIDGNAMNNKVDNFRLVCPNCDSQLPTYNGRNKGKGRKWRIKYTKQ